VGTGEQQLCVYLNCRPVVLNAIDTCDVLLDRCISGGLQGFAQVLRLCMNEIMPGVVHGMFWLGYSLSLGGTVSRYFDSLSI
jgi:hypothetical protein